MAKLIDPTKDLLTDVPTMHLLAELETRGFAVREFWSKGDVQSKYDIPDEEATEVINAALANDWIREQIHEAIDEVASARGYERMP